MPQGICVYAEHREGKLKKVSFELLGKGRQLADARKAPLSALLFGCGIEGLAPELIRRGADRVMLADHEDLKDYCSEGYSRLFSELVKNEQPEVILFPATFLGKDLSTRSAARLGAGLASDVTEL